MSKGALQMGTDMPDPRRYTSPVQQGKRQTLPGQHRGQMCPAFSHHAFVPLNKSQKNNLEPRSVTPWLADKLLPI